MEVIEKTRWEGDETVVGERMRRRMKRGMNEMKRGMNEMKRVRRDSRSERLEKTPDGREERLLLLRVRKQSES